MNIHTPLHTQNKKKENITQRWMISTFFSSSLPEWRLQTRSWQEGEHEIFTASCWDQWIQNDFSPKAMSEWNEWSPTHTDTTGWRRLMLVSVPLSDHTPAACLCVCVQRVKGQGKRSHCEGQQSARGAGGVSHIKKQSVCSTWRQKC